MTGTQPAPGLTRTQAEDWLYAEAALLDDGRLDDWQQLFTDDGVYWVPTGGPGRDPDRHVSLIRDDRQRIAERVWRLTEGPAHAQIPPSTTSRQITNVRVGETVDGAVVVRSRFSLLEVRKGEQRVFGGGYVHHLVPDGGSYRMRLRLVTLVNADAPIFNLTFVV